MATIATRVKEGWTFSKGDRVRGLREQGRVFVADTSVPLVSFREACLAIMKKWHK